MVLTENEAIEWIHSRLKFGSRPGLERVQAILAALDHPENKIPTIHIAGTNGKGSTVSYLKSFLMELGLTVGTFTSPYIESFNERMMINGQPIPAEKLVSLTQKVQAIVEKLDNNEHLAGATEFEIITAMGFLYFYEEQVDIAVIEVGLGGLLDCTNVITPILTGITTIGLDHQDILGESLAEIAFQKAGIIKRKVPLVTGVIDEESLVVINQIAKEKQATVWHYGTDYQATYLHRKQPWGECFDYQDEEGMIKNLVTPLLGHHQVENAAMAIRLFKVYCQLKKIPFQNKWLIQGLAKTFWPARMEKISDQPLIILDGAHNLPAMHRLVENLQDFKDYHKYILFSALQTKDVFGMLDTLLALPNTEIIVSSFEHPKSITMTEQIEQYAPEKLSVVSLWQFGLAEILENMQEQDMLLITGSLYFVSQVRQLLLNEIENQEEGV
ncbi:bifunctional folylpolyglutamate synthase/dihydrofolate synthase [Enterococcus columbae]|uniref:tetrahydrofolate synthase n=1 Tax=Enterococcus columbae DSM 7374 = ATCC 51263 TaxID=1121865 RepID=S0KJE1_9ENTE|nr:folylpolyglutamate synthase/dihydrofolate synthase family protein [Enterococcus columbae]EOT44832.1 FolC family protein [Enterococcus columbae DSM 7374 = ATCC 51263]EOW84125.1 FolC family protein [Enterococcus columbae DSM 7374 = ATCC 51263]